MHIILGGTSGLGLEMAKQLRERGERVLVLGKTHNPQKHGEGFPLDVYYSDQVEAASARIEQILNGDDIDQFVWAAGYGWRGNFCRIVEKHIVSWKIAPIPKRSFHSTRQK